MSLFIKHIYFRYMKNEAGRLRNSPGYIFRNHFGIGSDIFLEDSPLMDCPVPTPPSRPSLEETVVSLGRSPLGPDMRERVSARPSRPQVKKSDVGRKKWKLCSPQ